MPTIEGTLASSVRLSCSFAGMLGVSGQMNTSIRLACSVTGQWDPNVPRGVRSIVSDGYETCRPTPICCRDGWELAPRSELNNRVNWDSATKSSVQLRDAFTDIPQLPVSPGIAFSDTTERVTCRPTDGYVAGNKLDDFSAEAWQAGTAVSIVTSSDYVNAYRRHARFFSAYEDARYLSDVWGMRFRGLSHEDILGNCFLVVYQPAHRLIGPGRKRIAPPPPPKKRPENPFNIGPPNPGQLPLSPWSCIVFYLDAEAPERVLPCGRRPFVNIGVIYMKHTVALILLPEQTFVPCTSITCETDAESWGWRWKAEIHGQDAASIVHQAKHVAIIVDDYMWHGIAESYDTTQEFGILTTSISGRGRSALLAEPWFSPRSRIETDARTANQIADDEVYETGWTLYWDIVDWLIPANVFSYNNSTPIVVIQDLADVGGGIVYSDPADPKIYVIPRFKAPPWQVDDNDIDDELSFSVIESLKTDFQPGTLYKGVWVTGKTVGISGRVYRSGTDGSPYAPMFTHDYITTVDVAREKGKQILAASGKRARITIEMPFVKLYRPGQILRVRSGAAEWFGYVVGVGIRATMSSVKMSLTLDRPLEF